MSSLIAQCYTCWVDPPTVELSDNSIDSVKEVSSSAGTLTVSVIDVVDLIPAVTDQEQVDETSCPCTKCMTPSVERVLL